MHTRTFWRQNLIKQTQMIFRIDSLDLSVHQVTYVGSTTPLITEARPIASISEEIWWVDKNSPAGHGPFHTVYGAMKHYNNYIAVPKMPDFMYPIPDSTAENLIQADFKTKKWTKSHV